MCVGTDEICEVKGLRGPARCTVAPPRAPVREQAAVMNLPSMSHHEQPTPSTRHNGIPGNNVLPLLLLTCPANTQDAGISRLKGVKPSPHVRPRRWALGMLLVAGCISPPPALPHNDTSHAPSLMTGTTGGVETDPMEEPTGATFPSETTDTTGTTGTSGTTSTTGATGPLETTGSTTGTVAPECLPPPEQPWSGPQGICLCGFPELACSDPPVPCDSSTDCPNDCGGLPTCLSPGSLFPSECEGPSRGCYYLEECRCRDE